MIFVTVGTHEQPFNRLVEYMDQLKGSGDIKEDVIMQIGFSTYEPKFCEFSNFYSYQQMIEFVNKARIVITHGGPSSFIMPLQVGKIPIVVPRQKRFNEHVNDHQVNFAKEVADRMGTIFVVENIKDLKEMIANYDNKKKLIQSTGFSNNKKFNLEFENIINGLFY